MTRILVTGGAGYVGSVSVDAFLAAGHDVVVLDDLTTGHRAAVPDGARLHVGTYTDAEALGQPAPTRTDRGHPPLRRSLAGRRVDRRPGEVLPRQRRRRHRAARGRAHGGVGRVVFSSTAAVYGVPDATPIAEDAAAPADQPVRRVQAGVRERAGLVRPGVRPAQRHPALLQRGRRDRRPSARTTTRRRTSSRPSCWRRQGANELTIFGDDYPTARRHLHPRLHPRLRPRRRPPSGDRGDRSRRPATDEPLVCNLGNGDGFSIREVIAAAEARRRPGDPVRGRPASGGRPAGPRRPLHPGRRRPRLATRPADPGRDGRVGLALAAGVAGAATPTDPNLPSIGRVGAGTIWR